MMTDYHMAVEWDEKMQKNPKQNICLLKLGQRVIWLSVKSPFILLNKVAGASQD